MNRPRVSVIVPLYNQGAFLGDCLGSLQAQTERDWEAVVVDDGSTDDSLSAAQSLAESDPRIRVFSKPNGGLASARNFGLNQARGRFIQFLDSDDVLLPRKFELQLAQLSAQPPRSLSVSHFRYGRHDNLSEEPMPPLPIGLSPQTSLNDFIDLWEFRISVPCHCFLFSADLFLRGGLRFNQSLRNHEDFECWVRLLNLHPHINVLDEQLCIYRLHPDSMCRNLARMKEGFLAAVDLLLADSDLNLAAHRHLRWKKREIHRMYDRWMGVAKPPPFPLNHLPQLRIRLGALRRRFSR